MGFNCCEIRRDARIAGQPEWRPIGFHMTSITDRAVKVNSYVTPSIKIFHTAIWEVANILFRVV
jgi:hypothetical protein